MRDQINADEQKKINHPIPRDAFLFVYTAANHGHRKGFIQLLETFKRFNKLHPNSRLYLHTNMNMEAPGGYALATKIEELGLSDSVHYPQYDPIMEPVDDSDFRRLYNAADIYVSNSEGEGFGLGLIESQACGIPVIAPDNSSQTELVKGHGYLVDCVDAEIWTDYPVNVPTLQNFRVPNQKSLLEQMERAYNDETLRLEYGKQSREFALNYSWKKIMPKWEKLVKEVGDEVKMFSEIKASIKAGM